ncbi:MAG TPA: GTPase, partial [bacterium]|nr:GTPase [bacterium]
YRRTDRKLVPHGGDGGTGGKVVFRVDPNAPGLESFRMRQYMIAESGGHGGSSKKRGRNGTDLVILVQPGTRILDRARKLVIRELLRAGEEMVVLEGGRGGFGNQGGKEATPGEKGVMLDVELSIRIGAEIFFVGLPNSGKSKLLNALTGARIKEESYPFTTRGPEMAVLMDEIEEPVKLCELPSLYGASHEGRGMGLDFLKHLESARAVVYVLDPVSKFSASLKEGITTLETEIQFYDKQFLGLPRLVVVNKMDLEESRKKVKAEKFDTGVPVLYVSAENGEGLDVLKKQLREMAGGFKGQS